MKITVGLNAKSIKNAIKALETAKKQLADKMVEELLVACCERIKQRANDNIAQLDLGTNVKSGIQGAWEISKTDNGYKLTNTWHKQHGKFEMASAYVEFGVGVVGSGKPHPEANNTGYQYDVRPGSKDDDGTWYFYTNDYDLDLPRSAIDEAKSKQWGGRLKVATQGTQATRFLYKAVMDFADNHEAKTLWQEIKAKYWG